MGKTQRQLADEAFLRNEQLRLGNAPTEQPSVRELPKLDNIPAGCPECRCIWNIEMGVTPIVRPDQQQTVFLEQIECGQCGHRFLVDSDVHEKLRRDRLAHQARLTAARAPLPKKTSGRRTRGAG